MYEESFAAQRKAFTLMGWEAAVEALDKGYEESGYEGAMRRAADCLAGLSEARHMPKITADLYARAKDKDKALTWLERAYESRNAMTQIRVDPVWDGLRSEPRFQDIVRRMNFPE